MNKKTNRQKLPKFYNGNMVWDPYNKYAMGSINSQYAPKTQQYNVSSAKTNTATITNTTNANTSNGSGINASQIGNAATGVAGMASSWVGLAKGSNIKYDENGLPVESDVAMDTLTAADEGAKAGGAVMPGWGHLIGAAAGAIGGVIGSSTGNNGIKEKRDNMIWNKSISRERDVYRNNILSKKNQLNNMYSSTILKGGGVVKKYKQGDPVWSWKRTKNARPVTDERLQQFMEWERLNPDTPYAMGMDIQGQKNVNYPVNKRDFNTNFGDLFYYRDPKDKNVYFDYMDSKSTNSPQSGQPLVDAVVKDVIPMEANTPIEKGKDRKDGTPIRDYVISDEELGLKNTPKKWYDRVGDYAGNIIGNVGQLIPAFHKLNAKAETTRLDRPDFIKGNFASDLERRLNENRLAYNTSMAYNNRKQSSPAARAAFNALATNNHRRSVNALLDQERIRMAEFNDREAQRLQAHNYQLNNISNQEKDINMRARANTEAIKMAGLEDIANYSQRNIKEANDRAMDDRRYKLAVASARRGMTNRDINTYFLKSGGQVPTITGNASKAKPIAELERGEIVLRPNGSAFKVGGKKHSQGGEKYGQDVLPEGSLVLSDYKTVPGMKKKSGGKVTYAEAGESVLNQRKTAFNGVLDPASQGQLKGLFDLQQAHKNSVERHDLATKDSTRYFRNKTMRLSKDALFFPNLYGKEYMEAHRGLDRQPRKGKPGYDPNGYPLKKDGGVIKKKGLIDPPIRDGATKDSTRYFNNRLHKASDRFLESKMNKIKRTRMLLTTLSKGILNL